MGNELSSDRENDTDKPEEMTEFLDSHPKFLTDYIDRNPYLLDNYVIDRVDEETVKGWLDKVKAPAPSEVLQVLRIDYLKEKNTTAHHTDRYINNNLVVRRSGRFTVDLYFKNRAYLPAKDEIVVEFSIGKDPQQASGTKIRVPVKDSLQGSKWTCMLTEKDDAKKKVTLDINVPSDAIIGRYQILVETTSELESGKKTVNSKKPDVYVIFNPFSTADECYMANAEERQEYVLNDEGRIFVGQYYRIGGKNWLFGQFEEGILDIALKMLREDPRARKDPRKSAKKRSSATYCSRVLSAMVNCNDDDGVLWGNWSGKYEDGKSPTHWNGSVNILNQWNDKMEPVKYGQCWVFSGLLTTVLRAIGIPARPITNFRSAHDTEYNMTIDKFIGEDDEESELVRTSDSIWNFHVWTEGYFRRSDLPKGYNGWQAVDATPQEVSEGIMQCGPAPVKAVKEGEIYIGYDSNFVFGEVNADVVYWRVNGKGEVTKMIKRVMRDVGRNISTKAVGSFERHDVTDEYKYKEGTKLEREAFERAYAHGRKADWHDGFVIEEEGAITIDIKPEEAINGKSFSTQILVKNTTTEKKSLVITTVMSTMLNNEARKTLVKRVKKEISLQGGEASEQAILLQFSEYGTKLADENVIRVRTTARVKETDNLYLDDVDVQIESPDCLTIKCDDPLKRREYNEIRLTITNPLPIPLTGGEFEIMGSGVTTGKTIKATGPIAPGETYTSGVIYVRPYRSGSTMLLADFDCNEMKNIKAAKRITVASL